MKNKARLATVFLSLLFLIGCSTTTTSTLTSSNTTSSQTTTTTTSTSTTSNPSITTSTTTTSTTTTSTTTTTVEPLIQVTFDSHDGFIVSPYFVKSGMIVALPSLTREGYTFLGWTENPVNPTNIYLSEYTVVSQVQLHAIWEKNQHTVSYYIYDNYDPLARIALLSDETILLVATGQHHSAILTSTGRVFTWGINYHGQLGNDGFSTSNIIEITDKFDLLENEMIVDVVLGGYHSSARTNLRRLFLWGKNNSGQLGDGSYTDRWHPVDITSMFALLDTEVIVQLDLGSEHGVVLTSMGRIFLWGSNYYYQLGDGSTVNRNTPQLLTISLLAESETIQSICLGNYHTTVMTSLGRIFVWGMNYYGELGIGKQQPQPTPTELTPNFELEAGEQIIDLVFGGSHALALTTHHRVFSWGAGEYGQLGNMSMVRSLLLPNEITSYFPLLEQEVVVKVFAGGGQSGAITSLNRVFVWGYNFYGQLGDGTKTNQTIPTLLPDSFQLAQDEVITQLWFGSNHTAALTSNNRLFTWGWNSQGQLGHNHTNNEMNPTEITASFQLEEDEYFVDITLNYQHSGLFTSKGRIFTWGANNDGQLGDGSTISKWSPFELELVFLTLVHTEEIEYGSVIPSFEAFKPGFVLNGWYQDIQMNELSLITTVPARNVHLFGYWTEE